MGQISNRSKRDIARRARQKQRAALESFCCGQVEQIEARLAVRFGRDYDLRHSRAYLMPTNDHMSKHDLIRDCQRDVMTDCWIEVRR